jgi:hypothetical protein
VSINQLVVGAEVEAELVRERGYGGPTTTIRAVTRILGSGWRRLEVSSPLGLGCLAVTVQIALVVEGLGDDCAWKDALATRAKMVFVRGRACLLEHRRDADRKEHGYFRTRRILETEGV